MLFYHKGLRMRKKPLSLVAYDRKTAILRVQIWSTHSSDVVGFTLGEVSFLFHGGPFVEFEAKKWAALKSY
jgi:hypothetical protein